MVLLVDDGEILIHIPQVAGDECLQLRAQHGKRLLQLFIILGFHILLLSLSNDIVDHLLRHVEAGTEVLKRSILLAELATVLIDVLQTGVDDDALRSELTVEECVLRRVERYEEIGHDATAAIDCALLAESEALQ